MKRKITITIITICGIVLIGSGSFLVYKEVFKIINNEKYLYTIDYTDSDSGAKDYQINFKDDAILLNYYELLDGEKKFRKVTTLNFNTDNLNLVKKYAQKWEKEQGSNNIKFYRKDFNSSNNLEADYTVILALINDDELLLENLKWINNTDDKNYLFLVDYYDDFEPGSQYMIKIYNNSTIVKRISYCSTRECFEFNYLPTIKIIKNTFTTEQMSIIRDYLAKWKMFFASNDIYIRGKNFYLNADPHYGYINNRLELSEKDQTVLSILLYGHLGYDNDNRFDYLK